MTTEKLPCPFCGFPDGAHTNHCYFTELEMNASKRRILAAWNKRVDQPAPGAAVQLDHSPRGVWPKDIESKCRYAFEIEDGYGYPEANRDKYRVFRDGFHAGHSSLLAPTAPTYPQEGGTNG